MRFLLHLTVAALVVATGIGGMTAGPAADRDARAAVLGRQKIREELSAALAKGYLTRMDQYHILLHAKEVLSADDLQGLEQTMDRIAVRQGMARPAAVVSRSAAPVRQDADSVDDADERPTITPSKYEEPNTTDLPIGGEPMPRKAGALRDSPSMEEVPAGIGRPTMQLDGDVPEDCGCDPQGCRERRRWMNVEFFSSVDGFKGPLDLFDLNGNFGTRLGVNTAVQLLPRLGVGLQAGTSVVLSDFKGIPSPLPNATIRNQIFTTVGMFQRINREEGTFTWGFAYDWLFDDYYSAFQFGQWRAKAAWEFDPSNEIGLLVALPEHGSSAAVANPFLGTVDIYHFKPITQGYLYWKHTWCNEASLTGRFGVAERPGEFVFGGESRVPLTRNLALTSDFSYILPTEGGGAVGQAQEIWNVSVGLEFVLGGFGRSCRGNFQPFLPVANNGSLGVRETD